MGKTKKKTSVAKTILVSFIALVLGVCIGYFFSNTYVTSHLTFYLNGKSYQTIGLNKEYIEEGVTCLYGSYDYSNEVEITYYNSNKEEVEAIATTELTTYLVLYEVLTDDFEASITRVVAVSEFEDLEINFMMVGNAKTGDAIYIKAGDTDILVDAGSRESSAETITNYLLDETSNLHSYVSDNKLEYVIATHADQDHIAGFVGTSKIPGIFESFEIDTLIQFTRSDKESGLYNEYCSLVETLKTNGTNVYTALDCWNNANGASRVIEVAAGIEIEILYNYYYENKASHENNYSVCFMLRRGDEQYLFTGDLEKKGEEYLVEYNDLGEVYLYKLGHHGSDTSSTMTLLNVIKPEVVIGTLCAFTNEYSSNLDEIFPTTVVVNNLNSLGTVKHFYVNTMVSDNEEGYVPANGNIVVYSNESGTGVRCSESDEDFFNFPIFKQYRNWAVN